VKPNLFCVGCQIDQRFSKVCEGFMAIKTMAGRKTAPYKMFLEVCGYLTSCIGYGYPI
jgi:hypothetical protein